MGLAPFLIWKHEWNMNDQYNIVLIKNISYFDFMHSKTQKRRINNSMLNKTSQNIEKLFWLSSTSKSTFRCLCFNSALRGVEYVY